MAAPVLSVQTQAKDKWSWTGIRATVTPHRPTTNDRHWVTVSTKNLKWTVYMNIAIIYGGNMIFVSWLTIALYLKDEAGQYT